MKHLLKTSIFIVCLFAGAISCKKDGSGSSSGGNVSCNLPSTPVPEGMAGNWASGYNSSTDLVDAYSGEYLGNNFQSGKYFHFDANGKYAEFYIMVNGGLSFSAATREIGTVEFSNDNSFTFHVCNAHYRGWENGALTVDRDATDEEVADLTTTYYYTMETIGGTTWMEIKFDPNDESFTSFEQVP